jgi:hypothetical protein
MTQYLALARYFSLLRADSNAALHPVLVFMVAVGTIFVPKANEFSLEFPGLRVGSREF